MSKEYVEREVISEGIRKYYYKNPPNSSYQEGFDHGLDKAQRVILNAPVADVVEVRHGRWKSTGVLVDLMNFEYFYRCTACGRRGGDTKTNYCPHCGALMDKEE